LASSALSNLVLDTGEQRRTFFKTIFGPGVEGYLCVAYKDHVDGGMEHGWYHYPDELEKMLDAIEVRRERLAHFWFASALYEKPGDRHRSNVKLSTFLHADLDSCPLELLQVKPSVVIQTSPGRLQAYWLLETPLPPTQAEELNTRIAYFHKEHGADMCHDAGHLMRIPYTPNHKYTNMAEAPMVSIVTSGRTLFRPSDFTEKYPYVKVLKFLEKQDELPDLPSMSAEQVIAKYSDALADRFYNVYFVAPPGEEESDAPEEGWSGTLWSLMNVCLESGMNREETFIVANSAACNKFRRNGRGELALWQDVNRVYVKHIEKMQLAPSPNSIIPELLSEAESNRVGQRIANNETFIERYIQWAKELTDAPTQYHQAGAFVILSALLSGTTYIATSHERVFPNLWFMILAGTTLTRKSTAQRLAMRLLTEVYPEAEMATDGSVEGMLSALQDRPGQPSIFLKDEFTGLLDAIANKEYMAGFAEQLTKLYDGDGIKRVLRKETIEVKDPRFIIFAAGIKDKTQQLLTEEHVMSGFVPRFVFISGDSKLEDIQLTKPPKETVNYEAREMLKNELTDLYNHYNQTTSLVKDGKNLGTMPMVYQASLTKAAWERYNAFERIMMETANSMGLDFLMPVYVRLTVSTMKAALLIAASRQRQDGIIVEEDDLLHAIYYCQRWRMYASEIINGVGKTYDERLIDKLYTYISQNPSGVTRAELMRVFRLDVRRADLLFGTMTQRNMVNRMDVHGQPKYRRVGVD
jgi:hypothetical protein